MKVDKLGAKIRAARERMEISQADAAKWAGVGLRSLERWEAGEGNPSLEARKALAKFYGIPLADLL